jgi:ferrous iron transport protein A
MMSLELLTPGERGEITEVRHCGGCGCGCGCHAHDHENRHGHHKQKANATRAEEMGLRVGKMVKVLKNDGNLLLLLVDEARIAIDRRMARSINVKGVTA